MELDELVNRPRMYAFEDGVMELALGLMLVVVTGSSFLAVQIVPKGHIGYVFVPAAILLCSGLGMAWVAKKLKERVTYPRGGYVAFDEHPVTSRGRIPRRVLNAALMFAFVFGMSWFRHVFAFPASVTVAESALFLSAYTFEGVKYRMPHMLWLAAFSVLLGVWVYARNDDPGFVLLGQGVALAATGGIRLRRFIKSHPRPVETEA